MGSKKLLVLDNYDSFTYNLVHLAREIMKEEVTVYRNDEITLEEVGTYDKILLSPGPGIPDEAGILLDVIKKYAPTHSIFGVCLGEQAIGQAFGATLINLPKVYHGVATSIEVVSNLKPSLKKNDWFLDLDPQLEVGRYHSWVVSDKKLPKDLEITSVDKNGMIMSLRHSVYDVQGVQFHPESVLTKSGRQMLENWLCPKI
ncbi:MAG: aminodeoxychorismate/anthranilate synthase component II [Chitinophagia bacterium]|nr:aminodeoxychorismate/anthranilate synthase component II [Chitinophagia bacterium]